MKVWIAIIAVVVGSCGGARLSPEDARKADRYYEAAYIAWSQKHDNLEAIRHLTRAVAANPGHDDAHYLLGAIRLARGEYDQAEEHLRQAVALRADMPAKKCEAQNTLGVLLIHTKRYDEAISVLTEAASEVLNSSPWLAYGNLGWAYMEKHMYKEAEEALRRALFDQPLFCVGRYRLGDLYYRTKRYDLARQALEAAVNTEAPECQRFQDAHYLLGMTLLRLGDDEGARQAFAACKEIDARSPVGQTCAEVADGL